MFKLFSIILFSLFFSCKQTQEKSILKANILTKSAIQNEKSNQLNCEEVLMEIVKSSNLKSIKNYSEWKFRIEDKNSEKFIFEIYTENNLSNDPAKKQIVENAVSWLEFHPKTSELFDITIDPENPQELNFDRSIFQRNNILEICGVVSTKNDKKSVNKTECKKITDEMLSGEECLFYSTTIKHAYLNLISNKVIDDTDFLQIDLPQKSFTQKINKNGLNRIDYTISQNNLKIILYYDGGETTVEIQKRNNDVVRKILYSYD